MEVDTMSSQHEEKESNEHATDFSHPSHLKHRRPYVYTTLQQPNSFRLLVLRRGQKGQRLYASLTIKNLDESDLGYETVSYVWGAPDLVAEIDVDGQTLSITYSAHEVLERLRLPDRDRALWIDALCIDQTIVEDKTRQLKLMSRIYRQCVQCLAYLGPEQEDSELVPEFVKGLCYSITKNALLDVLSSRQTGYPMPRYAIQNELPAAIASHSERLWKALVVLICRPWFRRLWTLQEAVLPPTVLFICGNWELAAHMLHTLHFLMELYGVEKLLHLDKIPFKLDTFWRAWSQVKRCRELRAVKGTSNGALLDQHFRSRASKLRSSGNYPLTIQWLLWITSTREVTDPRDRFYVTLTLADSVPDEPTLTPDYTKQVSEVMNDYLWYLMRTGEGANILLNAVAHPSRQDAHPSKPSWKCIWHLRKLDSGNVILFESRLMKLHFEQSRWVTAVSRVSERRLSVRGFMVDQIHNVTQEPNDFSIEFFCQVLTLARSLDTSGTRTKDLADVIWRPLILDCDFVGRKPAPSSFLGTCEQWLHYKTHAPANPEEDITQELQEDFAHVEDALRQTLHARYGTTKLQRAGVFPACAQSQDYIFLIDGSPRTFLVRYYPDAQVYSWLGEIYVYDLEDHIRQVVTNSEPVTITLV